MAEDGGQQVNTRFLAMANHYVFESEFCNPASGWEKGQIEKNVQNAPSHTHARMCCRATGRVADVWAAEEEEGQSCIDQSLTPETYSDAGLLDAAFLNGCSLERIAANPDDVPPQKASVEAALHQARSELDKTLVVADTDAIVQQFALRPGDVVNPILRPPRIPIVTPCRARSMTKASVAMVFAASAISMSPLASLGRFSMLTAAIM